MLTYLFVNGFAYINGRFQKVNVGVTGERISYIGKGTPAAHHVMYITIVFYLALLTLMYTSPYIVGPLLVEMISIMVARLPPMEE